MINKEKKQLLDTLKKGLLQLNIKANDLCYEKILTYTEELLVWNEKINLTAITLYEDIIVKHFLDSLVCLKEINGGKTKLLDIGTGAGFPGVPLKIFNPGLSVFLMEAKKKKIRFLRHLLEKLDLKDIVLVRGRAEELFHNAELRETFNFAVVRAVGELKLLVKISFPFLKEGGRLLALKGTAVDQEVKRAQKTLKKMGGIIEKVSDYELISGRKGKIFRIIKGSVNV